ncbi:transcription factor bHLH168-like [Salvia miltiorrhiza]|uniref:transcription factor bHLH168-like n=1 Tax=Salvia miltiorrhiza TaxID=226208 RepID=UPI0025ABCAAA|nr:transcription factor bHLH168-like [Salvia miltiorrhiza]
MKRSEMNSKNKLERKTIEKNRRIRMKALGFKLVSIIPDRHLTQPKEFLTHLDQIDEAAAYIKTMRERIDGLKRRKAQLLMNSGATECVAKTAAEDCSGSELPILTVRALGHGVEVMLVSGQRKNFMLSQVISVIEEEAAQVLSVNISRVGDNVVHTLHAQVKISRVGVDTSRISDRLHEMISSRAH